VLASVHWFARDGCRLFCPSDVDIDLAFDFIASATRQLFELGRVRGELHKRFVAALIFGESIAAA